MTGMRASARSLCPPTRWPWPPALLWPPLLTTACGWCVGQSTTASATPRSRHCTPSWASGWSAHPLHLPLHRLATMRSATNAAASSLSPRSSKPGLLQPSCCLGALSWGWSVWPSPSTRRCGPGPRRARQPGERGWGGARGWARGLGYPSGLRGASDRGGGAWGSMSSLDGSELAKRSLQVTNLVSATVPFSMTPSQGCPSW